MDKHGKTDVEIVVIANKSDLVAAGQTPEVSEIDIAEFEQKTGKKVYMASAKNGQNVESTFLKLTETLITKHKPQNVSDGSYAKPSDGGTVLFTTKENNMGYCCM